MTCGIYQIENKINSNLYIGHAADIMIRWRNHKWKLSRNFCKDCNSHLFAAWKKYGPDNFHFSILEECAKESLKEREQHWADHFRSLGITLYNHGKFTNAPFRGQKHSKESLEKMSAASTGKNNPMYGKAVPKESQSRRIAKITGRKLSPETRQKLSVSHVGKTLGYKHTPESLAKMSASHKGAIPSAETRAKMSRSHRGDPSTGKSGPTAKLNWNQVRDIRKKHDQGHSYKSLAREYSVGETTISHIIKQDTWKE